MRAGRAREAVEDDRLAHLHRAQGALRGSSSAATSTTSRLAALFLDAVFLSVRPNGPKEGVLVAWGFTEQGERVLLSVMLGMRESHEDWLALGRDLIARGLGAPLLIVADGAPGLINAVEALWPQADRQRCSVHRLRNLVAKLPERERERLWLATGTRSTRPPASRGTARAACASADRRARARRLHGRGRLPRRRPRRAARAPALPDSSPPQALALNEPARARARSARWGADAPK